VRPYRGCVCRTRDGEDGHATGDWSDDEPSVELEYDYTCIVCGVTVPMCEGGGVWDDAVSSATSDSHVGVCLECSERLEAAHGDVSRDRALEFLYPNRVRFGDLVLERHTPRLKKPARRASKEWRPR
jgi:hypothetical protein